MDEDDNDDLLSLHANSLKSEAHHVMPRYRISRNRTRSHSNDNKSVIQENLRTLQEHNQKKKLAQQVYYSKQGNTSPLKQKKRLPVHQRLGKKAYNVPLGTNTSFILPKNKRHYNNQGPNNYDQKHYNNLSKNPQQTTGFKSNYHRRQMTRQRQRFGNQFKKAFILRRVLPQQPHNSGQILGEDLTIRVQNFGYQRSLRSATSHGHLYGPRPKFLIALDVDSQAAIKVLSEKVPPAKRATVGEEERMYVHSSNMSMNQRWSQFVTYHRNHY